MLAIIFTQFWTNLYSLSNDHTWKDVLNTLVSQRFEKVEFYIYICNYNAVDI